jgi:hypothetical protein
MRIELNYQAETLEAAICAAIVTSRGFIRDPGNNPREDVVQRLAEMAEKMRRERATADQPAESGWKQSQSNGQFP